MIVGEHDMVRRKVYALVEELLDAGVTAWDLKDIVIDAIIHADARRAGREETLPEDEPVEQDTDCVVLPFKGGAS